VKFVFVEFSEVLRRLHVIRFHAAVRYHIIRIERQITTTEHDLEPSECHCTLTSRWYHR
jgi:hypothetical protein